MVGEVCVGGTTYSVININKTQIFNVYLYVFLDIHDRDRLVKNSLEGSALSGEILQVRAVSKSCLRDDEGNINRSSDIFPLFVNRPGEHIYRSLKRLVFL